VDVLSGHYHGNPLGTASILVKDSSETKEGTE